MATKKVEPGADLRVIELPEDRLYEAADVLTRSFLANPNFVDLFPDGEARPRALRHVQRACLRDALRAGRVYAASRGGEFVAPALDVDATGTDQRVEELARRSAIRPTPIGDFSLG